MENKEKDVNPSALNVAKADAIYSDLVRRGDVKEEKRQKFIKDMENPEAASRLYDDLVRRGLVKEEKRQKFMADFYPGLHGVLPYADKRPEAGFESPVSMDKLPGLIRERKEQEQAKEDEAKKGFQDWLRTRDRKIEDARASLPGIREENDALYSAFSSLEQERAGRAVPGQDGDAPADALDSYGRMDAMNGQRMQDISQNLEYLDALEGQLDRMTSMQQASMPIPVGQEVKDRLIPEVRFDAVKQEELVPDLDRLSKEIGRVKSQTRALQQEYADSRIRLLETLDAAAALKMGGRILEEEVNDANREYIGMARELASSMSQEEAAEIYKYRPVVNDAIRNLDRMRKAAAVDGDSSAWKRFWQGMGAAFDGGRGLATLGLSDVGEGMRALQALKRVQEGNGSEADRILVESLADRANAESLMDGGHAYGIGQSLYGSLEFILDMAVTGGLAAGLRKGAVKGVKKAVGRKVADAAGKAASTRLGKAAVKGADMALASAISPMTMQGTVERQQQNYLYGRDNEGRLVVRGVSMPESWFKSYVNAFGSNLISRFVEQSVGPFAERNLFGRFFKALNRTTQKFTPSYIRNMRSLGKELGEQVRRAANVQGFAGENFEEFLEQPLQYWLIAQTGREKELGKEKAWSDVYGEGFLVETLGTVALMQALFSLPSAAVGTRSVIDNHAMMRKHLSRLDEATVKKLRGVMALEDDNARAQGLAGLLRDAGTDQQRMDILGYAVSRAASNMGLSWQRAEAQGRETEAYRQTLMAASSDGTTVTTAQDKDGNTFAVRAVEGDSYALAYPVADNGDGTVSLGAPVQRSMSDFDKGSMAAVPLETYLQGLSARQRAQGQAEDAAARRQDMAASRPEVRRIRPMVAKMPFSWYDDRGRTQPGDEGMRLVPVEDVPQEDPADKLVQVNIHNADGKGKTRLGYLPFGSLQTMLENGDLSYEAEAAALPVVEDGEGKPSPQGAGGPGAQAEQNKQAEYKDTVGGSPVALSYLLEGGKGNIGSSGYFLHGLSAAFPALTEKIESIRNKYLSEINPSPMEYAASGHPSIEEIRDLIRSVYGEEGVGIYEELLRNADGFIPSEGIELGRRIESLSPLVPAQPGEVAQGGEAAVPAAQAVQATAQPSENRGGLIGRSLTEAEAEALISSMEANAETAPELELTPENWMAEFGEDGMVETPIGKVRMGENQLAKMFLKKRAKEFGMVKPTLTDPDVVLEEPNQTKEGQAAERPSSYLFVKTFNRGGEKIKFYASVTVSKYGMEVVVSNHYMEKKALEKKMEEDGIVYTKDSVLPIGSDRHLAENPGEGSPDLLPTRGSTESGNKVTQNSGTEPTEAQKKAGNYKKEHVRIDGYNITIENPKGSIRSGVDGNGTPWSVTMNNSYGYIRGTEGLDGDHIDVFLSETPEQGRVFVIDQVDPETGRFDEHKVMYGFESAEEARDAYLSNYSPGWKGLGTITEVGKDEFRKWIDSSRRKTKPFSEYKSVKTEGGQGEGTGIIPLDDSGNPVYEQAPVEATWDDLMAQNGNDEQEALVTVQAMIENREAELESAQKEMGKKPKGKTVAEIQRSKAERKRKVEEASAKLDYWRKVAAWPEEKRKAEEHARKMNERNKRSLAAQKSQGMPFSKRHAELGDAMSFREDFLRRLATGGVQISEEAVRSMGMTKQDLAGFNRQYPPLIPKEGGESIEQLADDLWLDIEGDPDKAATYWDARSREDVERVIRDVFGSVSSKKGAMEEAERLHGETLEERQRKELEAAGIDPDSVPEAGADGFLEGQADTPEARKARLEEKHRQRQEADAETRAWMEEAGLLGNGEPDFHRSGERGAEAPTEAEAELRDAIVGRLRESGIEVVEDSEAGQRVLEMAGNGARTEAKRNSAPETASPEHSPRSLTVVSSADGAKILKNIDSLIEDAEKSSTQPKTFIGDLAKALGAKRYGSGSEYATFETVNGNVVTIRLSNHSASSQRMDNAGRDNAISIVVTPKPNSGITNDGNAHIVEFYYNAILLRRAEGKPLVEILKSIKQALYSGEYKDTTGLAEVQEVNADRIREQRVSHGSGADFDHFDFSYMGTGEGAQFFGYGGYCSQVDGISIGYAEASAGEGYLYKGVDSHKGLAEEIIMTARLNGETPGQVIKSLKKFALESNDMRRLIELAGIKESDFERPVRYLYTLEIPDDNGSNYLHWEKEVPEAMQARIIEQFYSLPKEELDRMANRDAVFNHLLYDALVNIPAEDGIPVMAKGGTLLRPTTLDNRDIPNTGKELYKRLSRWLGGDKAASEFLSKAGFTGISYPAEYLSGGRPDGARNFVIFKESDMKITGKVKFFRTPQGEAYGFTVGGKIYLDPRIAKADTPIHEYAHLWASALREGNPEEWANVAGLMKDTPVWEEVKRLYPELETDEEIADEVLATYSGRRGAVRLREAMREAGKEDGLGGRLAAMEAVGRVREALQRFWHAVADFLHIRYTTAEEVADRVLSDLLAGVNPGAFSAMNNDIRFSRTGNMKEDAEAFAGKHNLNVSDVTDYADYMAQGNLMGANRAFNEMRRKIRVDNTGMNLREFVKVFAPVREELYAKYGNLDELQSEYERKAEEDRSVMEAAKKRAEAEAEAEQRRLQGFRDMTDETLDAEYVKAVEANDENRMRDLVDEAARRKGYGDTRSEYQGTGAWVAPSNPGYETDAERRESFREDGGDVNVTDIAEGYSMQPEDYFTNPRGYGNDTPHGRESAKAINEALKEIREGDNPKIKVYRAVPKTVKEGKVRNGDWVTPSRIYAEMHGNSRLEGDYRIIEQEVPANNLWWDGNDVNEWGYDDGKEYAYRNTRNNRKLNDLVTRDDQGNMIPLSKRFDYRKGDPRFRQQGGRGEATDMESKRAAVEALGRKLNVEVVFEDEASLKKQPRQYRTASGWFDRAQWRKDGRRVIHVNLSNTGDAHEAEMTVLHEAVGHMGLRELLGAENYDPFLDMVHGIIPEAQAGRLRALVFKGHPDLARRVGEGNADGKDRETAEAELRRVMADEWLAELAEVGGEPGVWEQIVESFRMLLRRLGFELSLSESDIRALLFESRRNLESSRLPGEAERIREQQRDFREAARLDRIMEADMADMEADAGSEAPSFRQWYGGNSGYVGYSMSRRAAEAREEGRFPKTDFKKEYHVSEHALKALVRTGFIDGSEWHHTSKYGNRTPFYGWTDEASAQTYIDNKKEVDALSKEYDGLGMASPDNNADLFLEERMSSMRKERGYGMDFLTDGEKTERSRRMDEIGIADFGMDEAERARINAASEAVIDEYRELSGRRIREMEAEIQGMDEYKNRVEEEGRKEARRKEIEGRLEEIFGQQETGPEGVLFRQASNALPASTREQRREIRRKNRMKQVLFSNEKGERFTRMQTVRYNAVRFGQFVLDEDLPVKNLMNYLRRSGGKVSSATDLYELKTTVPSKVKYRLDRYRRFIEDPLIRHVRAIVKKTGLTQYQMDLYMIAKHGPERNRWMYARHKVRSMVQEVAELLSGKANIHNSLSDADMTRMAGEIVNRHGDVDDAIGEVSAEAVSMVMDELRRRHDADLARRRKKAEEEGRALPADNSKVLTAEEMADAAKEAEAGYVERAKKAKEKDKDFSGLTELAELEEVKEAGGVEAFVEMVEGRIRAEQSLSGTLEDGSHEDGVAAFWRLVNAATDFALDTRLECGLISRENYEAIRKRGWRHYVPLRSWDARNPLSDDYMETDYKQREDSQAKVFHAFKTAKGRRSVADSPLAYIGMDAETAAQTGEKNLYYQAVGQLVLDNAQFSNLFGTRSVVEDIKASEYDERMRRIETQQEQGSRAVSYKKDGRIYTMAFMNPRLAAAVRGDLQERMNRTWKGKVGKAMRGFTRSMAALNTALNPPFAVLNLLRDLGFGFLSRSIEGNPWEGVTFLYHWIQAVPAAFMACRKEQSYIGTGRYARLVQEWRENGGETGWHALNDLRETKNRLHKEINQRALKRNTKEIILGIGDAMRVVSEFTENSVRLAAYMDAKKRGMDAKAAAFYSKEITTNFNRRSGIGNIGGPIFMFLNAQTQGANRLLTLMWEHPAKFGGAALVMFGVGAANAVLAALYGENSGDEDDDYLDMSRYLRYNNFVLGHWTIPVAHGFRMFSGLGAAFGAYVMGDMEEEEFVADAMHIIGGELLAGPLNATDLLEYDAERDEVNMSVGNYFVNWIPSFLTPVAETIINRDFMGNPIHREPFTLQQEKYVPMVARSLPGTNPFLVNLTEKWAGLFGYDPDLDSEVSRNKEDSGLLSQWGDVSASSLEHILEGYGGGLLTTVNDVWKLAWKMHEGEPVGLSDIPVLKKLNRSVSPEKAILRDYYRLKEYIDWYTAKLDVENRNMVKPFIDAVSRGESIRRYTWMQGNPQIAPIYEFEAYKRMIDEFYELERTLRSTGSKGSEEKLRAERIKIQKRAARVENRIIMELNKERALRIGRYDDIKDENLRGLGQYLDAARRMYFAPLEGRGRE